MRKQAFMLSVLGFACGALGIQSLRLGWVLVWLGADFLILSAAYLTRSHRVFGKSSNGTLPLWSWCLFLPYLAYTSLIWNLACRFMREPAYNQVSDSLVIGRRLIDKEVPSDVANYVDLTAEFSETKQARQLTGYLNFPILDAGAPNPRILRTIIASLKPGKTFVHCAQGHGRTGLFALAFLVTARSVGSIDDGIKVLKSARPGIRLNTEQRRCVEAFARLVSRKEA
jgi:hypothetical protein